MLSLSHEAVRSCREEIRLRSDIQAKFQQLKRTKESLVGEMEGRVYLLNSIFLFILCLYFV